MITVEIKGLRDLRATLTEFSDRRFNAAIATALTRTALAIEQDWRAQFRTALDRPTPLTTRGTVVKRADARTLTATVGLREQIAGGGQAPAQYLAPQEFGGARGIKKFEQALVANGSMPASMRAVPGPAAQLDAFGNPRRQQIVQVLNQLGAGLSSGYQRVIGRTVGKRKSAAKRAGREYVAIVRDDRGLQPGVYERRGRGLAPVFLYVSRVNYAKRLRLVEDGTKLAGTRIQAEIQRAVVDSFARLRARG